jgi:glycosyltransferase involved in cell wall biosynthesis
MEPAAPRPVLLIGNYALDRQQSMLRFGTMMLDGLTAAGVPAELISPAPVLGQLQVFGAFAAKWLAYLDKFVLFPWRLRARLRAHSAPCVVHICDHSNAMYAQHIAAVPVVVTCHDMLAVRGALGDATDTPASATGRWLQRWIVAGMKRAHAIACVSRATCADAEQIVGGQSPRKVITLGLSYPYQRVAPDAVTERLRAVRQLDAGKPYVLHVGSNLRRKNRDAVLRIFSRVAADWPGQLVFAGEPLNADLHTQTEQLGIAGRIVDVGPADNELLEALYNGAAAFLFPSRFEGFGWPIAEAQACGAPVLCSAREPMSEVAGDGALLRDPDDEAGFASDLLRLLDNEERNVWRAKSLANARRFSTSRMIAEYRELYRSVGAPC